ncbi:DNA-binding protein [Halopseudomonas oceani]|uniref:helix-turn-helix transcriptional regulator n=1 Tax=Halopseudomonas oceani TaxID=1708783 RepID=UPI002AA901F9|nr:DNA-binding protein [Halopseudomonas oceani]
MNEFEFTLKFALTDTDTDATVFFDALMEAGCDDAVVGFGQKGKVALSFCRESATAFDAITSAILQVRKAIPGATLIEASPDFVGLSDVAGILGVTRQYVRKIMSNNVDSFPNPVHSGKSSLWHLHSILLWVSKFNSRPIDPTTLDIAKLTMELNFARESVQLADKPTPEIYSLVSNG